MITEGALRDAAKNGDLAHVRSCLAAGVPQAPDRDGRMPVYCAAHKGHTEVVTLLLENGATHQAEDKYGDTPLIMAAYNGHLDTVKLLIRSGASHSPNKHGKTPLDCAKDRGVATIAAILEQHLQELEQDDLKENVDNNINLVLRCQNLERQLHEVTAERDAWRLSVEHTEMKVTELERQCEDLQGERDVSDRELRNVRSENEQLEAENSNLSTRVEELQEQLDQRDAAL